MVPSSGPAAIESFARAMLTLRVLGPHSHVLSTLCPECPYAAAGCCRAPPRLDWSDLGRIVSLGGRDWLLGEIAAGRLRPIERGLAKTRRKLQVRVDGPRDYACVYLGREGCTIPSERRAATCNYYVCEAAIEAGGARGADARALHDRLVAAYVRWDEALVTEITARYPEGSPYDAAFFDWLGETFSDLARGFEG